MEQESAILEIYKSIQQNKGTSSEYDKLRKEAIELRNEFENDLNKEQKEQLDTLLEHRTLMEEVECREFFIEAFIIATKIMTEVFYNKDKE